MGLETLIQLSHSFILFIVSIPFPSMYFYLPHLLGVDLPDLANKNTEYPVKFEFYINNKQIFGVSISHAIFGAY